jgi:hypothetical protein
VEKEIGCPTGPNRTIKAHKVLAKRYIFACDKTEES